MGSKARTVVYVKRVKKGMPEEEWDESMPLPGDIIEGVVPGREEEESPEVEAPPSLLPPRGRSELSSQLRHLNRRKGTVSVKVRRGDAMLYLRARVALDPESKIQRRYTIQAARDDRHVAILADLTLDQVGEFQEMSRRVVNVDNARFHTKGIQYDWRKKVGTFLPDRHSTVISSILFLPFPNERIVDSITIRAMAWFSSVVSSGVPLVFVNIQTEQILTSDKHISSGDTINQTLWRDTNRCRHHISKATTEGVRGIRLWFLPGVAELLVILTSVSGETRFGFDIKQTEEGFISISSISKGSAADRAGLRKLLRDAKKDQYLMIISRLDRGVTIPPIVSIDGLIYCCDRCDIKDRLIAAINQNDDLHLHIMAWPNQRSRSFTNHIPGPSSLFPPSDIGSSACKSLD